MHNVDYGKIDDLLGYPGAMLSGSKDSKRFPKAVWNANVVTKNNGKLWFGDLDLSSDYRREALQAVADLLGEDVYVLREHDARFENEQNPKFSEAVEVFAPNVPL